MDIERRLAVLDLNARYAETIDEGRLEEWPDFFVEGGTYHLQPRENHDAGLPLCLLALESRAMIEDRVFGVRETMYHDPYYQRHVVGTPRVLEVTSGGEGEEIRSEANYIVLRTKRDGITEVFNAGRYCDVTVRTPEGLKFKSRLCVYDSELILNSIIYPI